MSQKTTPDLTLPMEVYQEVFRAAPDAIVVVDRSGRIRSVNPKVHEMFGYESGELVGELVEVLVPDQQRGSHQGHRNGYRGAPRSRAMGLGMELRGRRKDGSEFPIEVALSPFDSGDGECLTDCTIAVVRDVTERARTRSLAAARMQASEAERRRIAQDLHDDTAQRLAALLIQLRLVGRGSDGLDSTVLEGLRDQIEAVADGVRRVARGLRPPELDDVGLGPALRTWARMVSEDSTLRIELDTVPVGACLSPDEQLMIYRILQEAITNAARHSGGAEARVSLRAAQGRVTAEVHDDGCGFDSVGVLKRGTRFGLHGMLERATLIGADIEIESEEGVGTSVRVSIPCSRGSC